MDSNYLLSLREKDYHFVSSLVENDSNFSLDEKQGNEKFKFYRGKKNSDFKQFIGRKLPQITSNLYDDFNFYFETFNPDKDILTFFDFYEERIWNLVWSDKQENTFSDFKYIYDILFKTKSEKLILRSKKTLDFIISNLSLLPDKDSFSHFKPDFSHSVKDYDLAQHSFNVSSILYWVARTNNFSESQISDLSFLGFIHDLGKESKNLNSRRTKNDTHGNFHSVNSYDLIYKLDLNNDLKNSLKNHHKPIEFLSPKQKLNNEEYLRSLLIMANQFENYSSGVLTGSKMNNYDEILKNIHNFKVLAKGTKSSINKEAYDIFSSGISLMGKYKTNINK